MAKNRKMALRADNMPEDVYRILNEKANSRQLTAFIVELVQNEKRYEQLLQKLDHVEQRLNLLDTVENKLDLLLTNGFVPTQKQEDLRMEEPVLQEGKIIDAREVIGGISEEDNEEMDF
ncbi:hypothetical protein [Bacillus pseudomycoides]|uniref:hypothetical protein n=1 Tax=Bacillus pseudomycoides TaxID=64104 RepID=UPI000BEDB9FF|nr:hypothetical protein [Bacillus pseudomycoides]PEE37777.1 hypothetical protein COO02_23400 [Bacillus pseudomycoides]PEK62641.1 hypothetical protein CN590_21245 [Bacillus pseudomycoides]PGA83255.1 hypothetical protein COL91_26360 [Bacillus pseudomycoides]PGE88214.1 hypothetical protein COM55_03005 [Bacillus pseudomycoides]PHF51539.1 hypothetical protein COF72_01700 [Bacillus pseudomycoides]